MAVAEDLAWRRRSRSTTEFTAAPSGDFSQRDQTVPSHHRLYSRPQPEDGYREEETGSRRDRVQRESLSVSLTGLPVRCCRAVVA